MPTSTTPKRRAVLDDPMDPTPPPAAAPKDQAAAQQEDRAARTTTPSSRPEGKTPPKRTSPVPTPTGSLATVTYRIPQHLDDALTDLTVRLKRELGRKQASKQAAMIFATRKLIENGMTAELIADVRDQLAALDKKKEAAKTPTA